MKNLLLSSFTFLTFALLFVSPAFAQTTAFTYQGRFTDANAAQPTNGTYSMTFRLYDAASGGEQIGSPVSASVTVINGIFSAPLDFGAAAFNTAGARYLEIQVGSTILAPLQQITSTPFAQRAISAASADSLSGNCSLCVTNAQIASLSGSKVTGTVGNATTAATATNFSGSLSGDVAGTQGATVIQPNSVTAAKIASNQVVKSINNLKDSVTLSAGSGVSLSSSDNTLTFSLVKPALSKFVVGGLIGGYQYMVDHNLNSVDVIVQVYDANGFLILSRNVSSPNTDGFIRVVNANNVLVGIYASGTFRVVVIG